MAMAGQASIEGTTQRRRRNTDENLPSSSRGRPHIYFHFEFSVTLSNRREESRNHSITYSSRGLRERDPQSQFPRQLPPPNTNFLREPAPQSTAAAAAIHPLQQHPYVLPPIPASTPEPQHWNPRHASPYQRSSSPANADLSAAAADRVSRHASHSSQERGRSAPPPFNDSPWDAEPEPVGYSALPMRRQRDAQTGTQEPVSPRAPTLSPDSQQAGDQLFSSPSPLSAWPSWGASPLLSAQMMTAGEPDIISPESEYASVIRVSPRDIPDAGQSHNLAALSSAMMTVDNGFENQWWYQGPRERTVEGDSRVVVKQNFPAPAVGSTIARYDVQRTGLGWAVAREVRPRATGTSMGAMAGPGWRNVEETAMWRRPPHTQHVAPRQYHPRTRSSGLYFYA